MGDITHVYNTQGYLYARYEYNAWGEHKIYNATGVEITSGSAYSSEIGRINPFRYRSYYYDEETKLYYLMTRYYDPEVGRFISQDNIAYLDPETLGGLNLYAYCGNNPVMGIDPEGTWSWKGFWNIVAAVVIVTVATAVVVATAGGAAIALGASAAVTEAVIVGATVGGLTAGAVEIGSQIVNNGAEDINLLSVAWNSFSGAAYGAMSGAMGATTSGGLRLMMRGGIVALNTISAGVNAAMSGEDVAKSMGINFMLGCTIQGFGIGVDAFNHTLTTTGREIMSMDKDLFSNSSLLGIAGITAGKGLWKNFKNYIKRFLQFG